MNDPRDDEDQAPDHEKEREDVKEKGGIQSIKP